MRTSSTVTMEFTEKDKLYVVDWLRKEGYKEKVIDSFLGKALYL